MQKHAPLFLLALFLSATHFGALANEPPTAEPRPAFSATASYALDAMPPTDDRAITAPAANPSLPQATPPADSPAGSYAEPATESTAARPPGANSRGDNDLWQRIRNGFALAEHDSKLVRNHEAFYARKPEYMQRVIERSRRYLYHIVEEVEKRGMPTEIALLPIIESAYNPQAYSRSHASGIWQFIPSTGKHYGLKQNWWQDDRRDIVAATSAALDYLQMLHTMFGDWELALASYNWGEGAVGRSLLKNQKKGLPTDFRSLKKPQETENYIPKLIAMKNLIAHPEAYGLQLEPIPNRPYFERVATTRRMDTKLAASLAEIPLAEFVALNPAHSRPVINVNGTHTLLLPIEKAETFASNLENYDRPLVSWQAYVAKKGDTAESIAARFGLSAAYFKEVNSLGSRKKIGAGQTLLVPMKESADNKHAGADIAIMNDKPAEPVTLTRTRSVSYTVKKGDTLAGIAKRHRVSVAKLQTWNGGIQQAVAGKKIVIEQTVSTRKTRVAKSSAKKRPAKVAMADTRSKRSR